MASFGFIGKTFQLKPPDSMNSQEKYRRTHSWTGAFRTDPTEDDANKSQGFPKLSSFFKGDLSAASQEVWSHLPEDIRNDPSLSELHNHYEHKYDHTDVLPKLDISTVENERKLSSSALSSTGTATGPGGAEVNYNKQASAASVASDGRVSFLTSNITNSSSAIHLNGNSHKPKNSIQNNSHLHPPSYGGPGGGGAPNHDADEHEDSMGHGKKTKPWIKNTKIAILLGVWVVFTACLMTNSEKVIHSKSVSVPHNQTKYYYILDKPSKDRVLINLNGPFLSSIFNNVSYNDLRVNVELIKTPWPVDSNNVALLNDSDVEVIETSSEWTVHMVLEDQIDYSNTIKKSNIFSINSTEDFTTDPNYSFRLFFESDSEVDASVIISYDVNPTSMKDGVIYASILLLGLYILIIFEIVHRTFAAILLSTLSIGVLAACDMRPTTTEVVSWIDVETLLLLFSMMILVAILSETGIFDYLAVLAYKVTGGRVWPLINCLCFATAFMSSFLDNVTTILLMTPVTIRLCEVMELNPVPILMSMIIFSNVGGTLTPVGDPPNVIIASNAQIVKAGINFTNFTMHMSFGIFLVAIQTYIHLRIYFRDVNSLRHSEPKHIQELRHEISIWQRAAASLSSYTKDEDAVKRSLMKKVNKLVSQLKKKLKSGNVGLENYKANLEELTQKYPVRNKVLLVKSTIAVTFVILLFFLHSIPQLERLSLGWTALLGALLLLILADREDIESVLARVEWCTLLFFAALFVLMEALAKLGLIDFIGKQTETLVMSVGEESRLTVAILLILWVSAIASAFVDNIPLTTMMVKIATSLGNNPTLNLPLQPLVWALAFGACLGGNGTLIGASANVVCAGVAEQHGYRFTFMEYFKVGFPTMLGSIVVITGYLLFCHVGLGWNG